MGTQFWWFYDVIAAAILLVSIFICGKKGVMKAAFSTVGCVLAVIIAFAMSNAVAESIYKTTISSSNVKKLNKVIDCDIFSDRLTTYLENMGYSIVVNHEKLNKILLSENVQYDEAIAKYVNNINAYKVEKDDEVLIGKVREGFAVVIRDIVSSGLNKYAAETAAEKIREDSSGMQELIPLLMNDEQISPASEYISKHYAASAYITIIRLCCFIVLYIALALIFFVVIRAFMTSKDTGAGGTGSRVAGGVLGVVMAFTLIFAVAVFVRTCAVMGSNEMLFFNHKAVSESYVFKYFYDFTMKM